MEYIELKVAHPTRSNAPPALSHPYKCFSILYLLRHHTHTETLSPKARQLYLLICQNTHFFQAIIKIITNLGTHEGHQDMFLFIIRQFFLELSKLPSSFFLQYFPKQIT